MFATTIAKPSTSKPTRLHVTWHAHAHGGSFALAPNADFRARLQAGMDDKRSPSLVAEVLPAVEPALDACSRAFGGSDRITPAQVRDDLLTYRSKRVSDLICACVHLDQDAAKRVLHGPRPTCAPPSHWPHSLLSTLSRWASTPSPHR